MLPVAELRVGHERYWLREVAESLCDYYAGRGEAEWIWRGGRALAGGLAGREAEAELVTAMFAGIHPATGGRIAQPVWRTDPRAKLDAAPLAHALTQFAAARGLRPEELARSGRAALGRTRGPARDRITVDRADRLSRLLGLDPRQVYGGLRWRQVDERTGTAEIAGLDDPLLLRAFSSRSDQVAERKAEWAAAGLAVDGIRTSGKAARATRKRKDRSQADERTVYGRWEAELAGHGIDAAAMARVHGLHGRDRQPGRNPDRPAGGYRLLTAPQAARLLDRVAEALTTQASTFSRRELLNELAKQLPPRPGSAAEVLAELTGLADRFLGLERVVRSPTSAAWTSSTAPPANTSNANTSCWPRPNAASASSRAGGGGRGCRQAIAEHPTIGADQARLVRDLTRGDGVVCGVGPAGYGKTYAMKVLARACALGQVTVLGLAPTGEAAETLRAETGIDTDTVDSFLLRIGSRRPPRLRRGTVLVVDEASMVSTRNLASLLGWAERAGVFVRPVGDHRQYASVEAGGGFRGLQSRLGATRLTVNRRQQTPLGRQLADLARAGRAQEAGELPAEQGKTVVCRTRDEADQRQARDWYAAYTRGGTLCRASAARTSRCSPRPAPTPTGSPPARTTLPPKTAWWARPPSWSMTWRWRWGIGWCVAATTATSRSATAPAGWSRRSTRPRRRWRSSWTTGPAGCCRAGM